MMGTDATAPPRRPARRAQVNKPNLSSTLGPRVGSRVGIAWVPVPWSARRPVSAGAAEACPAPAPTGISWPIEQRGQAGPRWRRRDGGLMLGLGSSTIWASPLGKTHTWMQAPSATSAWPTTASDSNRQSSPMPTDGHGWQGTCPRCSSNALSRLAVRGLALNGRPPRASRTWPLSSLGQTRRSVSGLSKRSRPVICHERPRWPHGHPLGSSGPRRRCQWPRGAGRGGR
jgi:hypothetical protein